MSPVKIAALSLSALGLLLTSPPITAASFYEGKTFTVYIGSSPGGGYSRYARTVGHHIAKHIPGNPNIVFVNMPGAGSRKLTAWYSKIAPKNGLIIAAIFPGAVLEPLFGKKGKYDPLTFNCIGSANAITLACVTTAKSGFLKYEDLQKRQIIMAPPSVGRRSTISPRSSIIWPAPKCGWSRTTRVAKRLPTRSRPAKFRVSEVTAIPA